MQELSSEEKQQIIDFARRRMKALLSKYALSTFSFQDLLAVAYITALRDLLEHGYTKKEQ